jgi:hypothetical protein
MLSPNKGAPLHLSILMLCRYRHQLCEKFGSAPLSRQNMPPPPHVTITCGVIKNSHHKEAALCRVRPPGMERGTAAAPGYAGLFLPLVLSLQE